ncbi:MAG TPA: HAD family hydrolase [Anaerolineales bacterium]
MFSPNGIKAILFDLDGTLRHDRPDGAEVFISHAIEIGLPIHAEDRLRALRWEHYYWANSTELKNDFKQFGNGAGPEFWLNYGRRQLVALGLESMRASQFAPALNQHMQEAYKPESILAEEAASLLRGLKEGGFKLGVVSNRERPFHEEIERLEILPYFDLLLAAGEVGFYKPEPGIFQAALERIGVEPKEAVYVGDNYFADVVGSQRAGLRPVLYDPRGVYLQPDCDVIQSFGQLPKLLK